MTDATPHRLSEKNFDDMTAVCAVDGPVKMRSRGKGRVCCSVKKSEKHRDWAARNPEQARRNRRSRSDHRLTSSDPSTMTGECPVCGTVGAVIKGRRRKDGTGGLMCANRAKELWRNLDEEPQDRCGVCRKVYLGYDGSCSYCDDRAQTDLGYALMLAHEEALLMKRVLEEGGGDLTTFVDLADDAREMPRTESAVPGWKTIGAGSASKWWADNGHLVESDN